MEINSSRKNRNRQQIKDTLETEKIISEGVERWFDSSSSARLETMIPNHIKRDLKELTGCIDTKGTKSQRASNRLIVEALVDLFRKYKQGEGEFSLTDEPVYKGDY